MIGETVKGSKMLIDDCSKKLLSRPRLPRIRFLFALFLNAPSEYTVSFVAYLRVKFYMYAYDLHNNAVI